MSGIERAAMMYSSQERTTLAEPRQACHYWIIAAGQEAVEEYIYIKKRKTCQRSRGCSTSAGNELIKREKEENSLREGGTGRVGAANGIVFFFLFFANPGAHVCVWRSTVGISLQ